MAIVKAIAEHQVEWSRFEDC